MDKKMPIKELISAIQRIASSQWCQATGGNFSTRIDEKTFLISRSGVDKQSITERDFIIVDLQGKVLDGLGKPSAETLIHTFIYQKCPETQTVLHTHSLAATIISRLDLAQSYVSLEGFEMQKSLQGITTHQIEIKLPIFQNQQDMQLICASLAQGWDKLTFNLGFLLSGHGLYARGTSTAEALRHIEGLEFLLECELNLRKLGKVIQR